MQITDVPEVRCLARGEAGLRHGLSAGELTADPLRDGPTTGRARRWMYAAAGGPGGAVGCAVVSIGPVGTAFAWAALDGSMHTWERRIVAGRGLSLGPVPAAGATYRGGGGSITLDGIGGFTIDVPTEQGGRLRADVAATPVTPVVLVTATPNGGWNATEKCAGHRAHGAFEVAGRRVEVDGGWRDWTAGRQDRHTSWRWAAGAGGSVDGRSVGINVSTGMNGAGEGEDVVWWDGHPHALDVSELRPVDTDPRGPWIVAGPGWELELRPWGTRAAEEDLRVVRSRYVQPVGRFGGTLPGPDGAAVTVRHLVGVTEEHEATW